MAYINDILLGRITKVSGYEGAVTIRLEKSFIENIPQMESVFLEIEGRPVPFFITDLQYSGADLLKLTFAGYDSIEKVSEFTGCRVFLTSGLPLNDKAEDIQVLTGYQVFLQDGAAIGVISEIISNTGQFLLRILSDTNKEILIPLHQDFIVKINKKKKSIIMDIPEGLLDIN